MEAIDYINSVCADHPELYDQCATLYDLYQRKLWHQLTINLQQFFFLPVLQTGDELIQLYDNFIIHFETEINPLRLAEFAVTVSHKYLDKEAAINHLRRTIEKLNSANQKHIEGPILFIRMQIAAFSLGKGDYKKCKNLIDIGKAILDSMTDIDQSVYAHYYWVTCQYCMFLQDPVEFYKNAIQFLAYASVESLPDSDKRYIASHACITAMVGDNIYDFGELLAHPIIKSLLGSPSEWIYRLLEALNSGNLVHYQELCRTHETCVDSQPALVNNEKKLLEKINIIRLMEFIFRLPPGDRIIPLTTIAEFMKLTVNDVEHLLLKSLSVGLIEGIIDEVDGTVDASRVQPRVLEMSQIKYLRHRLAHWLGKVQWVITSVETGTPEYVVL
ncbi:26S proteasome non-ATPase regulatory subunit 13 homolog B-like [Bidens hawaiensis]|uniref:26S proteasome non-ATPase regulatory subunit 13 homolog B-like n=1 Tax=Bidens hawaiensis TaxID=980011 RepID=UPI0040492AC0